MMATVISGRRQHADEKSESDIRALRMVAAGSGCLQQVTELGGDAIFSNAIGSGGG